MKSDQTIIRKSHMEHIHNNTELLGIKDKNIAIESIIEYKTHICVNATLDYKPSPRPNCKGKRIKYDFQRVSTIPILDILTP